MPQVVLCVGSFCAVGRFVQWVILSSGRFVPWAVLCVCHFVMGRFELGPFRDGPFCMCTEDLFNGLVQRKFFFENFQKYNWSLVNGPCVSSENSLSMIRENPLTS